MAYLPMKKSYNNSTCLLVGGGDIGTNLAVVVILLPSKKALLSFSFPIFRLFKFLFLKEEIKFVLSKIFNSTVAFCILFKCLCELV